MLEQKKAVIFDLDGTLVDSMWMWKEIDIEYLAGFGYACPDDLQRTIEGMSFSETAVYFKERFQIPDSLDEIKAAWTRMSLEKYRNEVPLKPGAKEFLDYLKSSHMKAGIATSNGRILVDTVLESLNIREGLSKLGEREKKIINLRFFVGKTQMEVSEEIGISQAQVSRLEKGALMQLRKYI